MPVCAGIQAMVIVLFASSPSHCLAVRLIRLAIRCPALGPQSRLARTAESLSEKTCKCFTTNEKEKRTYGGAPRRIVPGPVVVIVAAAVTAGSSSVAVTGDSDRE